MLAVALFITASLFFSSWKGGAARIRTVLRSRRLRFLPAFFAFFLIAGPILCATRHIIFHDEPTVIATAIAEAHGQPLYHAADSADRYSLLYGPATYWLYMPPMLLGHDLRAFQLWVMLPLFLFTIASRKLASIVPDALGRTIVLVWAFFAVLLQSGSEWAMKGDAWLLCLSALQFCAALFLSGPSAVLAMALCGALMVDIKITTVVLAFVPLILYAKRRGALPSSVVCGALLVALAASAFLVKGVSFTNYLFWLEQSRHHGISLRILRQNLSFLLAAALPVITLATWLRKKTPSETRALLRANPLILAIGLVACAVSAISGAKVGAGPWHCVPLVPMIALLTGFLWTRTGALSIESPAKNIGIAVTAALLLAGTVAGVRVLVGGISLHWHGTSLNEPRPVANAVADDLREIVRTHPGEQIGMGYGDNKSYEITWQRPLLVEYGSHYSMDADSLAEMDLSGVPLPVQTLQSLRRCDTALWLIPKGDAPFSLESLYYMEGQQTPKFVFPDTFRAEFTRDFRPASQSRYFDLWTCKRS